MPLPQPTRNLTPTLELGIKYLDITPNLDMLYIYHPISTNLLKISEYFIYFCGSQSPRAMAGAANGDLRLGVLGAGAVGCYIGAVLHRNFRSVTLVGRSSLMSAVKKSRGMLRATNNEGERTDDATVQTNISYLNSFCESCCSFCQVWI